MHANCTRVVCAGLAVTTLDTGHSAALQCRCTRGRSHNTVHQVTATCITAASFDMLLLQALPIFLDKLLSPVLAVVLSVTAVLLVGKRVPVHKSPALLSPCFDCLRTM